DALLRIIDHSGCRLIFADATNAGKACEAAATRDIHVIGFNTQDSRAMAWDGFAGSGAAAACVNSSRADETAILIYTSGTTGEPKAVELTTSNLAYQLQGVVEPFALSPDHRILSVLPFSHVLPLIANGLGALWVG